MAGILSTQQGHLGRAKGAIQGAGSLPVLGCSDSMDISPMSSPTVSPDILPTDITPLPSPMEWMAEEDL
ncbi:hypothetical protein NUU61_007366 [Penicillium alfredii]|uniref:Uncharacterized protein n=1 Tax=Penicillium alfredii TaxID=1506179 RepID=A0A9W9F2R6_9EURO|nr:uncharacterized protein NUU61_007366 [Penicillium alfredii]KAJ5092496.1 hypothetical protein NUU61_007366 [Penicillium alfredii]